MKVAFLSTYNSGGAARAALNLCRALRLIGVESRMFVKYASGADPLVEKIGGGGFYDALLEDINLRDFAGNVHPGNTMLSLPYGKLPETLLRQLHAYDVIHLHWVARFISPECLLQLARLGKPLFWTLHDQHALTGACHYTHGCAGYTVDCGDCPQMAENRFDVPRKFLEIKRRYMPRELVVITPGRWLADCARKSVLFRAHKIEKIQYSIALDVFRPYDKAAAKERCGIAATQKVILFGASHCRETRKGFQKLVEAIAYLKDHTALAAKIRRREVTLLLFGHETEIVRQLAIPFIEIGYVDSDEALAWFYSAADVVALPSLEDNMPLVMLEAIACGTPVIGFAAGGMRECIVKGRTGYQAPWGDAIAFARAIAEALLGENLSGACRLYAETHFEAKAQAKEHCALYETLLRKEPRPKDALFAPVGAGGAAEMFPETFELLQPKLQDALERLGTCDAWQRLRFLCGAQYQEVYFLRLLRTTLRLPDYGERSVAIWGTGDTARKFVSVLLGEPESLACIRGFFDGEEERNQKTVFGRFERLDAARATEYGLKAILIASQKFEMEIYREIQGLEQAQIRILRLFDAAWETERDRA